MKKAASGQPQDLQVDMREFEREVKCKAWNVEVHRVPWREREQAPVRRQLRHFY